MNTTDIHELTAVDVKVPNGTVDVKTYGDAIKVAIERKLLEVLSREETTLLTMDERPFATVLPIAVEIDKKEKYLLHFSHDPTECYYTCWRHDRSKAMEEKVINPVQTDSMAGSSAPAGK